jgi:hypothetical protein
MELNMTKSTTIAANRPTASGATVSLKLVIRDIVDANPTSSLASANSDKKVRVWLRANMKDAHERNAAWAFDAKQYDKVRAQFDPSYAAAIAPAPRAPRKATAKAKVTEDAIAE